MKFLRSVAGYTLWTKVNQNKRIKGILYNLWLILRCCFCCCCCCCCCRHHRCCWCL